jgi:hypothetical protein
MKMMRTVSLFLVVALITVEKVSAGGSPDTNPFFGKLISSNPAELPAKSAELVMQAKSNSRQATTIEVVKAAVGLNPAAAPAIVGTISESTPESSPVAAATAVGLLPDQAIAIARAAAAAAPAQAGKIVEAVCRVVPNVYQEVANAVFDVAPKAGKDILAGLTSAIPALAGPINKTLVGFTGDNPNVRDVLNQVAKNVSKASLTKLAALNPVGAISPAVGPPYVPPPASPVNQDPGSGGPLPPYANNYAAP